ARPARRQRFARDVEARDPGGPARRRDRHREHANRRGLAGAVRPDQAEDLAGADLEVEARDGLLAARVHLPNLSCLHHRTPPSSAGPSHRPRTPRLPCDGSDGEDVTVDAKELQAEEFERHRPQLRAVAYRMLGSLTEADDAVQEAWLRLNRADGDAVANMGAWLTTVVARISLDMLRARRARREESMGDWLPEPIVAVEPDDDPEAEALIAASVGLPPPVVLETLTPAERLAFVLSAI